MAGQTKIGENEGIDSAGVEDVAYEPSEKEAETPEERSDAQRIADGDIVISTDEDEMFVSPDTIYVPDGIKSTGDEDEPEDVEEEKASEEQPEVETTEKSEKDEKVEKPSKKKPAAAPDPVQKRINKVIREKYEAARKAEELAAKNKELEDKLREYTEARKAAELELEKPDFDSFDDVDDYYEALSRWSARVEFQKLSSQAQPTNEAQPKAKEEDPREKILNLGQETYGDFIEKVSSIPISKEVFEAVKDSDHAHEILYYLGEDPDLAAELSSNKSVVSIARTIGRIEDRFIVPEVVSTTGGNDTEIKRKISSAPKPIKPVAGRGTVIKDPESMSLAEYYASRGYTRDGMKKTG